LYRAAAQPIAGHHQPDAGHGSGHHLHT
jgi:hypothetical protein